MKHAWHRVFYRGILVFILVSASLFVAFPKPVHAAAPSVQSVTGQTADVVNQVVVSNIPGGTRQLYIAVVHLYTAGGSQGTSEVSSMSGGGLTWSLITGTVGGAARIPQPRGEMWWAYGSPSDFSLTVNLNNTTLAAGAHVAVVRISGAANQMPINGEYSNTNGDQGAFGGGTDDTAPTIGATVSNANSLILNSAYPRNRADGIDTPDADYTQQYEVTNISGGNASTIWIGTRADVAVGTETITHTLNSAQSWFMLVTEVKAPPGWESYDDGIQSNIWGTVANSYDGTYNTVYMYGEGFEASQLYHVGFYDPSGAPNKVASTDPTSAAGALETQYLLTTDPIATAGTWHAVVYKDPDSPPTSYNATDPAIVADDSFEVLASAIPEFPTVIAAIAVAGFCFGIYYWMRKRRLASVKA